MRISYYFLLAFFACSLQQLHGGVPPTQAGLAKKVDLLHLVKRPGIVDTTKLTKFLKRDAVTSGEVEIDYGALDEHGWNIAHHFALSAHKAISYGELDDESVLAMARQAMSEEKFAALLNTQVTATAGHPLVVVGDTVAHILPRLDKDHSGAGDHWLIMQRDYIDPNIKNSKGMTPVFEAIAHGKIEMLKTLRAYYKVKAEDETLMSPLHVAVANSQSEMFYELLRIYEVSESGSGVKKVDDYLAELNEQGETVEQHIVSMLERYRAEIGIYRGEVEQLVGENVLMVKELFLQGKSPMASPGEYYLIRDRVEKLERMISLLEKARRKEERKEGGFKYIK